MSDLVRDYERPPGQRLVEYDAVQLTNGDIYEAPVRAFFRDPGTGDHIELLGCELEAPTGDRFFIPAGSVLVLIDHAVEP